MRDSILLLAGLLASLLVAAGSGFYFLRSSAPVAAPPVGAAAQPATPSAKPASTPSTKAEPANADPTKRPDPEPLPELPKADPKSQLTPLLPDKSLYLEKLPDGKKRVLLAAEVCVSKPLEVEQDPLLEVFLCRTNTKEHEAILRTGIDARFIHAALEAAGAKKGSPVQFVNPKTGDEEYKPATGGEVKVTVVYAKGGKLHSHLAREWIRDRATGKPMAHEWVFAGSRFVKNPDAPPDAPDYYLANNGEVIAVSNFPDSMLDLPVKVSRDNAELTFEADMKKIPPPLTKVWVILEPVNTKA